MAKFIEALTKPRFFSPLVPEPANSGLTAPRCADGAVAHDVGTLLVARAMLNMSDGKLDDARRDLLASHRLARLIGQGPLLIHFLMGVAIEHQACVGDAVLSQQFGFEAAQARDYMKVLQELGPCKAPLEKVEFGERLAVLNVACRVARTGPATCLHVQALMDNISPERRKELAKMEESAPDWDASAAVDWNQVLRLINARMDRMAAALKISDPARRDSAVDDFRQEIAAAYDAHARAQRERMSSVLTGRIPSGTQPALLADWLSSSLIPNLRTIDTIDRVGESYRRLGQLALALSIYRQERQTYPASLAALAPAYFAEVPIDPCSGADFHYSSKRDSYVLYGVGPNRRDDGGRTAGEGEGADDLVIRATANQSK